MFITTTTEEACSADFSDYEPLIGMVLPREGSNTGTTPVHIYGRNFTRAICQELRCKFGDIESPRAMYITNNHIICEAPDICDKLLKKESLPDDESAQGSLESETFNQYFTTHLSVPIKVDFGDGKFVNIERNFTYKYNSISQEINFFFSSNDNNENTACALFQVFILILTFLTICFVQVWILFEVKRTL